MAILRKFYFAPVRMALKPGFRSLAILLNL